MGLFCKKKKSNVQKIFCIGLSGTGTRSLNEAFNILGYNSKHYPRSLEDFQNYDVLLDIPVSCRYRDLDVLFPNSRFILTMREMDSWLDNRSRKPEDVREKSLWVRETRLRTYGFSAFDREHYIEAYTEFHDGVDEYFSLRSNDLLKMDIIEGDGCDDLCSFLNISEIPSQPFPVIRNSHSPVK